MPRSDEDRQRFRAYNRKWINANRDKKRAAVTRWKRKNPMKVYAQHLRKVGFTIDLYNLRFVDQHGLCAICKTPACDGPKKKLFADHDHKTNKPRGLLCGKCNAAIGLLKDSVDVLRNAQEYLELYA